MSPDSASPAGHEPATQPYQAYLDASRMPLTGLWFTLPLFLFYHVGMWWLQRTQNGGWLSAADLVIARGLAYLGAAAPFLSFIFVVFAFFIAQQAGGVAWRRPRARVWMWMALESLVFALPVFLLARATHYVASDLRPDWLLAASPPDRPPPAVPPPGYDDDDGRPSAGGAARVTALPYDEAREGAADAAGAAPGARPWTRILADLALSCGAGVYEEFLFRMILLGSLAWVLRWWTGNPALFWPPVLLQALVFAAFHHLPGSPEPVVLEVFAFRTAAGIYFAYLYLERGFGIAAGAHAGYDIVTVAV